VLRNGSSAGAHIRGVSTGFAIDRCGIARRNDDMIPLAGMRDGKILVAVMRQGL
jgi:hypothetical protein